MKKINYFWKTLKFLPFAGIFLCNFAYAFKVTCFTPSGPNSANAKFYENIQKNLTDQGSDITIEILDSSHSKITQGAEIEAMQRGELMVGLPSPQDMLQRTKGEVYDLFQKMAEPNKIKTDEELKAYWNKNLVKIEAAFALLKLTVLGLPLYHGVRNLHLVKHKKPLNNLDDIKALKLRLRLPNAKNWKGVADYFNAQAVEVKHPDISKAITQDKFDAFESTYTDIEAAKLDDNIVQSVPIGHLIGTVFFVMSSKVFEELTSKQKEDLKAAVEKAVEENDKFRKEEEKRILDSLKNKGVVIPENFK